MKKSRYAVLLCVFGCLLAGNILAMHRIDLKRIPTGHGPIYLVKFDRSGDRVLTDADQLWDASTGKCLLKCDENSRIMFDQRREMLFAFFKGCVQIYDPKNAGLLLSLPNAANVTNAAIDKPHARIATADSDKTVRIWDAKTASCVSSFAEHAAVVTSMLFFKRNPLVLTTSEDTTCKIWDLRQPSSVKTLELFSPVISGEVNRAENVVVCSTLIEVLNRRGGKEKAVKVYIEDWASGKIEGMLPLDPSGGEVVLNRPSNRVAVASGLDHTWVKDLSDSSSLDTTLKHGSLIHHVAMNRTRVATAGLIDRTVKIWDPKTLERYSFNAHCCKTLKCEKSIGTIACDRGGSFVLAGQGNGTVKIWNINSGNNLQQFNAGQEGITESEFSRAGNRFATGSFDGTLAIGTSV